MGFFFVCLCFFMFDLILENTETELANTKYQKQCKLHQRKKTGTDWAF